MKTSKAQSDASRILEIYTGMTSLIREYKPTILAVERVFFAKNVSSALSTQAVISICLYSAEQSSIASIQITPQEAKAFATGSGRSSKQMVRKFVEKITRTKMTNDHTADAAAVAIAGLMSGGKTANRVTQ